MTTLGAILTIISFLSSLIALWREFSTTIDASRAAEAQKKTQDREKAIDDLGKAQTEEEFDEAQSRVVRNRP